MVIYATESPSVTEFSDFYWRQLTLQILLIKGESKGSTILN